MIANSFSWQVRSNFTGYLQELIYKLSKVGQAIENNDLAAASSLLGPSTNADWVQNVNAAFAKVVTWDAISIMYSESLFEHPACFNLNILLVCAAWQLSTSPEEKIEVDNFNSSLASLFSSGQLMQPYTNFTLSKYLSSSAT